MNKAQIIKYYDTILNEKIFGKCDLKGYKTDCYKFCPYLRKRGNILTNIDNYKEDFKVNQTKWLKDKNYLIFLEAFELIEPKYKMKYNNINDIKLRYQILNNFFNALYSERKQIGAGYLATYYYYIKLIEAIIKHNLMNFQAMYLFNFMFKKIIEDIRDNRLNDDIWINNYVKYLEYWDKMPWYFMF